MFSTLTTEDDQMEISLRSSPVVDMSQSRHVDNHIRFVVLKI